MSWPRQSTDRPAANSSCIWELVITSAIEKAPGGAYKMGMGTIISCYHDPKDDQHGRTSRYRPAVLARVLAVLKRRAALEGWGGSDFPWSWARLYLFHVAGMPLASGGFYCPCCRTITRLSCDAVSIRKPPFTAYAGQCPGCSIIWWW
jgi:hypothetical protein